MLQIFDKIVLGMAGMRLLSASVELTAALLMLKYNNVAVAFKINSVLAMVGPMILVTVTSIGLFGLMGRLPWSGMLIIILGVLLIFVGMSKL
jgi:hypothetical protein